MHELRMKRSEERLMKKVLVILCFAVLMASFGCQNGTTTSAPVIGITSVYRADEDTDKEQTFVNFAYVRAVADNGGAIGVDQPCEMGLWEGSSQPSQQSASCSQSWAQRSSA